MSGQRVLTPGGELLMRPDGRAMLADSGTEPCCGPPGNCCIRDPEQPECGTLCVRVDNEQECYALGGDYGEGCPECESIGACCAPSGDPDCPTHLCRLTTAAECAAAGGVWHGRCVPECAPDGPCGVTTERAFGLQLSVSNYQIFCHHHVYTENTVSGCGARTRDRGENLLAGNGIIVPWCADASGRPLAEIWTLIGGTSPSGDPARVLVQTTAGSQCHSIGPRQTILHLSTRCNSIIGRARWLIARRAVQPHNCAGEQVFTYPGYNCALCLQSGPNVQRAIPRRLWGTVFGSFCWSSPPFPSAADYAANSTLSLGVIDLVFRLSGFPLPSVPHLTLSELAALMETAPYRYAELAVSCGLAQHEFYVGSPFQHEWRYYTFADYSGPMSFSGATLVSQVPNYTRRTQAWTWGGSCSPPASSGTYYGLTPTSAPLGGLSPATVSVFELAPAAGC